MGRNSLKEKRQQEIIEAFYDVARKIGLENASIAKVADYMDINPSLIVHYFRSREALLEGLVRFTLEKYQDIFRIDGQEFNTARSVHALINNLFSRKWNVLFDDGVFFSCYALTYRNKKLRQSFKSLHDSLRELLATAIRRAKRHGVVRIQNEKKTVSIIFALMEGGYYYLGMVDSKKECDRQMQIFKKQALGLLGL